MFHKPAHKDTDTPAAQIIPDNAKTLADHLREVERRYWRNDDLSYSVSLEYQIKEAYELGKRDGAEEERKRLNQFNK